MATVETSTVTLTINDREITVPKGLSLVEAAAEAGIEVPVFCYEPRLGAAVGACRMCLVDIEGLPKLQTACTTPAADGMIVRSQSDRAREGQDAVLEFLLINHPLDCPVCDKGGECPLQDLTFRYGPGSTRMTLPKRTHDKPIPISPLIKLDRDRCILCYRCTRFSESVSGDLQLVTENRGADSVITTFEGRPYDGEFSGNVTELCPVGALTSTTYRFRGRPWEIQNVPTICGHCAVGCNTYATIREGRVARVLSRNHPGIDEGWLCDKGRYVHTALDAPDRIRVPMIRAGRGPRGGHPDGRARPHRRPPADDRRAVRARQRRRAGIRRADQRGGAPVGAGCRPRCSAADRSCAAPRGRPAGRPWRPTPHASPTWMTPTRSSSPARPRSPTGCRWWSCGSARPSRTGARVVTVGAGGTRLQTLRGTEHISAAPGATHTALLAALGDAELHRSPGSASVPC